jgi:hypothetical protein
VPARLRHVCFGDAQAVAETKRATSRAVRRTARTQSRVMASAARQLGHLAKTMEHSSAAKDALAVGAKRSRAAKAAQTPKPPSREEMRFAQERAMLEQQATIRRAHHAARRAEAARAEAPTADDDFERRLDALATRVRPRPRPGPARESAVYEFWQARRGCPA